MPVAVEPSPPGPNPFPPESPPPTSLPESPDPMETDMQAPPTVSLEVTPEADPSPTSDGASRTIERLVEVAEQVGLPYNFSILSSYISGASVLFQTSNTFRIHDSTCSWRQYYPVLSFLLSGQLHADYVRLSGWLGLPPCSQTQWQRIVKKMEQQVNLLAEWSCSRVRQMIVQRGDDKKWVASFDGFYLTRGHYSNNASATIHDHKTGDIAWFTHRTKKGPGHNWEGTSGGAEGDMFDEVMGKVKDAGFNITEIITDKDSSTNAIFCRHFPEGTITYCSNHCAKTLHKDLEKIKRNKCVVSNVP